MTFGPDGYLYVSNFGAAPTGQILRISVHERIQPEVRFDPSPESRCQHPGPFYLLLSLIEPAKEYFAGSDDCHRRHHGRDMVA